MKGLTLRVVVASVIFHSHQISAQAISQAVLVIVSNGASKISREIEVPIGAHHFGIGAGKIGYKGRKKDYQVKYDMLRHVDKVYGIINI